MKWISKLETWMGVSNLLDRLFCATVVIMALLWGYSLAAGQDQPHRAAPQPQCVRVLVDDGGGSGSAGTGALIAPRLVMTCNHVVEDRASDSVKVVFPGQGAVSGQVFHTVETPDLAFILLDAAPSCEPLRIASKLTSPLSVQGYGSGPYRQSWGVLSDDRYVAGYRTVSGAAARSGDSGGPVIDASGKFVGTLFGTVDGETYFTPISVILKHLPADAGPTVIPVFWRKN
jgi:S1-C subfamily serine protease